MRTLRIGILDEEESYVGKLAAYLNRWGKGQWSIVAFTDKKVVYSYLEKRGLDVLAGTDKEEIKELEKNCSGLTLIWLAEKEDGERRKDSGIYSLYRYQSAKTIGKMIENIVREIEICRDSLKPIVAVYSPVGRCGKTSFALDIVKDERYGRWAYVGMEDYSFFGPESGKEAAGSIGADTFLYFVKERKGDKVLALMEESSGIIPSAFSPFDTKQIEKEDIEWLQDTMKQSSGFRGMIFDIGTGVLKDFDLFLLFDALVVPYLMEEKAVLKREKFETLLEIYGLDDVKEKTWFINMEKEEEILEKKREIFTV